MNPASFHSDLDSETEWRQQPTALTQRFPTPRAAVFNILDTFSIVERKDEAEFNGDYHTKRSILEIYDAITEAQRSDRLYQTRLDQSPAAPRCCHQSEPR